MVSDNTLVIKFKRMFYVSEIGIIYKNYSFS